VGIDFYVIVIANPVTDCVKTVGAQRCLKYLKMFSLGSRMSYLEMHQEPVIRLRIEIPIVEIFLK